MSTQCSYGLIPSSLSMLWWRISCFVICYSQSTHSNDTAGTQSRCRIDAKVTQQWQDDNTGISKRRRNRKKVETILWSHCRNIKTECWRKNLMALMESKRVGILIQFIYSVFLLHFALCSFAASICRTSSLVDALYFQNEKIWSILYRYIRLNKICLVKFEAWKAAWYINLSF